MPENDKNTIFGVPITSIHEKILIEQIVQKVLGDNSTCFIRNNCEYVVSCQMKDCLKILRLYRQHLSEFYHQEDILLAAYIKKHNLYEGYEYDNMPEDIKSDIDYMVTAL